MEPVKRKSAAHKICVKILPRETPKGKSFICEMCSSLATLRCSRCGTAYYCTWAHRYLDSLHGQLCERLRLLHWPRLYCPNQETRDRYAAQKNLVMSKLLEDLIRQSFTDLYARNYHHAICTFVQSLKYIADVYGEQYQTLQLISIHTAICESQIGQSNLDAAEKSLNAAQAVLWKAQDRQTDCPLNFAKAEVNKTIGLFKFATKHFDDAVFFFSECIYYVSEVTSPTDARTCVGYFNLGKSFMALTRHREGISLLIFCAGLWYNYLTDIFMMMTKPKVRRTTFFLHSQVDDDTPSITTSHYLELQATRQLEDMWEYINEVDHPDTACRVVLCQGILLFMNKNYTEAREYGKRSVRLEKEVIDFRLLLLCKELEKHAARREIHA